jgi:hypothetical protein
MSDQMPLFDVEVITSKLLDAMEPATGVEFDPEEAHAAGAFVENALTESDVDEAQCDLWELAR